VSTIALPRRKASDADLVASTTITADVIFGVFAFPSLYHAGSPSKTSLFETDNGSLS
jgi:hypothetical protein